MDAEEALNLFDFCWFEHKILHNQPSLPTSTINPDHQIKEIFSKPDISILQLPGRSMSDQTSAISSLSPDSVFIKPTLKTIHSGKEMNTQEEENQRQIQSQTPIKKVNIIRRKKRRSKSLSELEFEELKGFMDLGFVFSKEDKDSNLVSIVPGLHRLGKEEKEEEETGEDKSLVSRPYLSEAWEDLDEGRENKPLMNWRVPSFSNEVNVKDSLRWWAHTVASTVR